MLRGTWAATRPARGQIVGQSRRAHRRFRVGQRGLFIFAQFVQGDMLGPSLPAPAVDQPVPGGLEEIAARALGHAVIGLQQIFDGVVRGILRVVAAAARRLHAPTSSS